MSMDICILILFTVILYYYITIILNFQVWNSPYLASWKPFKLAISFCYVPISFWSLLAQDISKLILFFFVSDLGLAISETLILFSAEWYLETETLLLDVLIAMCVFASRPFQWNFMNLIYLNYTFLKWANSDTSNFTATLGRSLYNF